jgi:zinc transport system substrate-binding protein
MKKAVLGLLVLTFIVGLAVYFGYHRLTGADQMYKTPDPNKVNVVATIYPLGDFAGSIGHELVDVTIATPPGIEPHDFEPTPRQVAFMLDADVFVMNGGGIDAWADEIASQVRERGGKVVNMSEELTFRPGDPHAWLDPKMAEDMARYIRYALIDVDPTNREKYLSYTDEYLSILSSLDSSIMSDLENCQVKDIFVAHDAFNYFAARYNLIVHPLLGLSPDAEPSAKDLAELSSLAKELQVKTIFFETLVSPKLAKTLAREVGAKTDVLDPIENVTPLQSFQGQTYASLMLKNVEALRGALMCQ